MPRILHFSDSHGRLPRKPAGDYDVVVCTGDFMADDDVAWELAHRGLGSAPSAKQTVRFQEKWLADNAYAIARWIGQRPFVWCAGNHDFFDPCETLRKEGVEVHDATNKIVRLAGLSWYGFPFINAINGYYMHERDAAGMARETQLFITRCRAELGGMPDVLLAHAPLADVYDVDKHGNRWGNSVLRNGLAHLVRQDLTRMPRLFLCGHVHKSGGGADVDGMLVYNSAETANIIEIDV